MCRNTGVTPQEYLANNSKAFTSAEFSRNLANFEQVIRFAGVGAHHHNAWPSATFEQSWQLQEP
jgi:hypothetical protein